MLDVINMS